MAEEPLNHLKTPIEIIEDMSKIADRNNIELVTINPDFYQQYNREELLQLTLYLLGKYRERQGKKPLVRLDDVIVQYFFYFPSKLQLSERWPFPNTDLLDSSVASLLDSGDVLIIADNTEELEPDAKLFLTNSGLKTIDKIFDMLTIEPWQTDTQHLVEDEILDLEAIDSSFPIELDTLQQLDIYKDWEDDLPGSVTIGELSSIFGVSRSSPFSKYIDAFEQISKQIKLYNFENITDSARKLIKFLILQAYYRYDYLGRELGEHLDPLVTDFNIEEEVKKAKIVVVDDLSV